MNVSDVMTPGPEALETSASIEQAARLMRDGDFGVVPIVEPGGTLTGVVTDRDIVVQAVADGRGPATPVGECMTRNPECVTPQTSVERAMALMSSRQIRRLPVVENGRLVGMLSLGDIATTVPSDQEKSGVLEDISTPSGRV